MPDVPDLRRIHLDLVRRVRTMARYERLRALLGEGAEVEPERVGAYLGSHTTGGPSTTTTNTAGFTDWRIGNMTWDGPQMDESVPLEVASNSRAVALQSAVLLFRTTPGPIQAKTVLRMAEQFEEWLDRP